MSKHNESRLQSACVKWFRLQYPYLLLFAIPNGGKRSLIEAKIMKGEGVLAGVADLFLSEPKGEFHGLYIEMKVDKGQQTDNQKWFEQKAKERGYQYVVSRSLDNFMEVVKQYLDGN